MDLLDVQGFVMMIMMLMTIMTPSVCVTLYKKVVYIILFDSKNALVMIMTILFVTEPLRAHNSCPVTHKLCSS